VATSGARLSNIAAISSGASLIGAFPVCLEGPVRLHDCGSFAHFFRESGDFETDGMDPARLYAASEWAKDVLSNIRTSEERLS
jgi:hypothetical protein